MTGTNGLSSATTTVMAFPRVPQAVAAGTIPVTGIFTYDTNAVDEEASDDTDNPLYGQYSGDTFSLTISYLSDVWTWTSSDFDIFVNNDTPSGDNFRLEIYSWDSDPDNVALANESILVSLLASDGLTSSDDLPVSLGSWTSSVGTLETYDSTTYTGSATKYRISFGIDSLQLTAEEGGQVPVPEPATMLLLGSGLVGLAAVGRKKFFKK